MVIKISKGMLALIVLLVSLGLGFVIAIVLGPVLIVIAGLGFGYIIYKLAVDTFKLPSLFS